jgi:peptide/nickel transport system substrate-binding protein/oligopeptide transport system substrate-binding protein
MSRVVPRRYVERVGNEAFARRPIGSGPFRFAGWTPGDRVVLTAFEEYTPRAWLDSLVLELPEHDTSDYAVAQYLAGRLSALVVPDGRMQEFADLPGTTLLTRQQLTATFIGLNSHREPFDDVRVRQAFALAIDRAPILAHRPESRIQAHGILPPGMPGFTPESKFLPHDLERARILLAAAGYPGGKGLPTIVFTTASRNEQTLELIGQIAGQVGQVGFVLQTEHLGWLDFSRRLTGRELQCFSVSWVADVPDPDSFLYPLCHSQGSANYGNFDDREVDGLLARGRRTGSSLARLEVYREAERRVLEQAALVPLFHPLSVLAVRSDVRGLTLTSMGVGSFAMESVWLAEPAPRPAPLAQAAARPAAQAGTQLAPDPALPVPPDAAPSRTAGAGPRPGRKP